MNTSSRQETLADLYADLILYFPSDFLLYTPSENVKGIKLQDFS